MTLKIISAEEIVFEGEVQLVTLPGSKGRFTVLDHHASIISCLDAGTLEYVSDGERNTMNIDSGLVDVDNNVVSVCLY